MLKPITAFAAVSLLTACGIFNLGGTTETGEPKTEIDARLFIRSLSDAALRTWGTEALRREMPDAIQMLDLNNDGVLALDEVESFINVQDPAAVTSLLVVAITLYKNRPR